jgi:hypothetical protein
MYERGNDIGTGKYATYRRILASTRGGPMAAG